MFTPDANLPAVFLAELDALANAYMAESDPIRQSGFSGGESRWRAEREPLLDAVNRDGTFLDIGCANGYLLECLGGWASERGISLELHGVEQSALLVEVARARLAAAGTIHVGNAWDWMPPRRYDFVYTLYDVVPESFLPSYVRRLVANFVTADGRIILGAYGSRSRSQDPFDVVSVLEYAGFSVAGVARGGDPPVSLFAWTDAEEAI